VEITTELFSVQQGLWKCTENALKMHKSSENALKVLWNCKNALKSSEITLKMHCNCSEIAQMLWKALKLLWKYSKCIQFNEITIHFQYFWIYYLNSCLIESNLKLFCDCQNHRLDCWKCCCNFHNSISKLQWNKS